MVTNRVHSFNYSRLRVELARDRNSRDRDRDRDRDRSSRRGSSPRRFGGGRDSDRDRGGRGGRGNPPGRRTPHRLTVENLSSKTSWQVGSIKRVDSLFKFFFLGGAVAVIGLQTSRFEVI